MAEINLLKNPLDTNEIEQYHYNGPLIDWLQEVAPTGFGNPIRAFINEEELEIKDLDREVGGNDTVLILVMPAGGAVLTFMGKLLLSMAASYVIGFIFSPKDPLTPIASEDTPNPVYSLLNPSNKARPNEPIPVIYGEVVTTPDYISSPYYSYLVHELSPPTFATVTYDVTIAFPDGTYEAGTGSLIPNLPIGSGVKGVPLDWGTRYLFGLFCVGIGKYLVKETLAGDVDLSNNKSFFYEYHDSKTPTVNVITGDRSSGHGQRNGNIERHFNANIKSDGSPTVYHPKFHENVHTSIAFNDGNLLKKADIVGKYPVAKNKNIKEVQVDISFYSGFFYDTAITGGKPDPVKLNIVVYKLDTNVQLRNVTVIIEHWSGSLAPTPTVDTSVKNTTLVIPLQTSEPVSLSIERISEDIAEGEMSRIKVTGVKGVVDIHDTLPQYGDVTLLATRIKSSEFTSQLASSRIRARVQRASIPKTVGNGGINNPANVIYDIWSNEEYGAGRDDSTFDIELFKKIVPAWGSSIFDTTKGFNGVFNEKTTIFEAMESVANLRASNMLLVGSQVSIATDNRKETRTQLFTMANIIKDSFRINYNWDRPGEPDGVEVEYMSHDLFEPSYALFPDGLTPLPDGLTPLPEYVTRKSSKLLITVPPQPAITVTPSTYDHEGKVGVMFEKQFTFTPDSTRTILWTVGYSAGGHIRIKPGTSGLKTVTVQFTPQTSSGELSTSLKCQVGDIVGGQVTSFAFLTVKNDGTVTAKPVIIDPQSLYYVDRISETKNFQLTATSDGATSYNWKMEGTSTNFAIVTGANTNTVTVSITTPSIFSQTVKQFISCTVNTGAQAFVEMTGHSEDHYEITPNAYRFNSTTKSDTKTVVFTSKVTSTSSYKWTVHKPLGMLGTLPIAIVGDDDKKTVDILITTPASPGFETYGELTCTYDDGEFFTVTIWAKTLGIPSTAIHIKYGDYEYADYPNKITRKQFTVSDENVTATHYWSITEGSSNARFKILGNPNGRSVSVEVITPNAPNTSETAKLVCYSSDNLNASVVLSAYSRSAPPPQEDRPFYISKDPRKVKLFGCTSEAYAMAYAKYLYKKKVLDRKTVSFSTELEGRIPRVGDRIGIAHDMPSWGQSGNVIGYDGASTLTLDQDIDFSKGALFIVLRDKRGKPTYNKAIDKVSISPVSTSHNQVLLDPAFVYSADYTEYAISTNETVTTDFIIDTISPNEYTVDITATLYVEDKYKDTLPFMDIDYD